MRIKNAIPGQDSTIYTAEVVGHDDDKPICYGVETNYLVMLLMLSHYGSTTTCQIFHTLLIFPLESGFI